jgi:hypothetical protein
MSSADKKYHVDDIQTEDSSAVGELYGTIDPPSTSGWNSIKHKFTTRDGWIGDYDYRALW